MKTLERILLVDDDTMDNTYHTLVLRKAACAREIVTFTSAAAALDYLKANRPVDLVFLDLNMPHMNGFEFAAALAALPPEQQAPIIMLCGSSDDADRSNAEKLPEIRDYLCKPLTQNTVKDVMARLFAEA